MGNYFSKIEELKQFFLKKLNTSNNKANQISSYISIINYSKEYVNEFYSNGEEYITNGVEILIEYGKVEESLILDLYDEIQKTGAIPDKFLEPENFEIIHYVVSKNLYLMLIDYLKSAVKYQRDTKLDFKVTEEFSGFLGFIETYEEFLNDYYNAKYLIIILKKVVNGYLSNPESKFTPETLLLNSSAILKDETISSKDSLTKNTKKKPGPKNDSNYPQFEIEDIVSSLLEEKDFQWDTDLKRGQLKKAKVASYLLDEKFSNVQSKMTLEGMILRIDKALKKLTN